jgi:hypothetical protein
MKFLLKRSVPTLLLAVFCLVVGTAGGSVAASLITGAQIKNGTVTGRDIKNGSLLSREFANNSVTSGKVRDGSILGADVNEATLGTVPHAASATNADKIDGLDSTAFIKGQGRRTQTGLIAPGSSAPLISLPGIGTLTVACSGSSLSSVSFTSSVNNMRVILDDGAADPSTSFLVLSGSTTTPTTAKANDHLTYLLSEADTGDAGPKWQVDVWTYDADFDFCSPFAFAVSY